MLDGWCISWKIHEKPPRSGWFGDTPSFQETPVESVKVLLMEEPSGCHPPPRHSASELSDPASAGSTGCGIPKGPKGECHNWLVVEPYPSEKYECVIWDDEIPNWVENNKCSKAPTNIAFLLPSSMMENPWLKQEREISHACSLRPPRSSTWAGENWRPLGQAPGHQPWHLQIQL